jgi:hypothetical protein
MLDVSMASDKGMLFSCLFQMTGVFPGPGESGFETKLGQQVDVGFGSRLMVIGVADQVDFMERRHDARPSFLATDSRSAGERVCGRRRKLPKKAFSSRTLNNYLTCAGQVI